MYALTFQWAGIGTLACRWIRASFLKDDRLFFLTMVVFPLFFTNKLKTSEVVGFDY